MGIVSIVGAQIRATGLSPPLRGPVVQGDLSRMGKLKGVLRIGRLVLENLDKIHRIADLIEEIVGKKH